MTRLPVTVIGGYLGSGKTTLVNHLLRNADGKRLAVLVNEFGELPIDEDLIIGKEGDVIALAGGCVCCSYGDDLTGALIELAASDDPPDLVLLEASGVAMPGAIAGVLGLFDQFELTGIVVLADAQTICKRLDDAYVGDTIRRQVRDADLVLLTKVDLASEAQTSNAAKRLAEFARDAQLLSVANGEVDLSIITSKMAVNWEHGAPLVPKHDANIFVSRSMILPDAVTSEALKNWLEAHAGTLVRAKGFARSKSGGMKSVQLSGDQVTVADVDDQPKAALALIGLRDGSAETWLGADAVELLASIEAA
ncbi:MAG: CobW family GTP-binding protein [Ahrensia sp.]|nr:CobW family GTP-binding protein [Ahrensia sp.]